MRSACGGSYLFRTERSALAQVNGIMLSEEQVQSLLRMRELYLHNLGALMRRRQELSALLRVLPPRNQGLTVALEPCSLPARGFPALAAAQA